MQQADCCTRQGAAHHTHCRPSLPCVQGMALPCRLSQEGLTLVSKMAGSGMLSSSSSSLLASTPAQSCAAAGVSVGLALSSPSTVALLLALQMCLLEHWLSLSSVDLPVMLPRQATLPGLRRRKMCWRGWLWHELDGTSLNLGLLPEMRWSIGKELQKDATGLDIRRIRQSGTRPVALLAMAG